MKTFRKLACIHFVMVFVVIAYGSQHTRAFECGTTFHSRTTFEDLVQTFGSSNVIESEIHVDEGFYEFGALVFPGSQDELQVFWHDPEIRQSLRRIRIQGNRSSWRMPSGLELGLDLHAIEALNRRPFRLRGFGWDYGGTIVSWENGDLESTSSETCRPIIRLTYTELNDTLDIIRENGSVDGMDTFSSGHPTMQLLNPTVREISLIIK